MEKFEIDRKNVFKDFIEVELVEGGFSLSVGNVADVSAFDLSLAEARDLANFILRNLDGDKSE